MKLTEASSQLVKDLIRTAEETIRIYTLKRDRALRENNQNVVNYYREQIILTDKRLSIYRSELSKRGE